MSEDKDFLCELQDCFLNETTEIIGLIEESFLLLENDPSNAEELAKVFRLFHSIKGTASAVEYTKLASFCHTTENLLNLIRTGKIPSSPEIVDVLLKTTDLVAETIQNLKKDKSFECSFDEMEQRLKAYSEGTIPMMKPVLVENKIEIDEKLLADYLIDADEQLDVIDSGLLFLEKSPEDKLILDAVFRGFHTLKSGASIMGFSEVEQASHYLESILEEIRASKQDFPLDKSSACLDGANLIRKMIVEIKKGNHSSLSKFKKDIEIFTGTQTSITRNSNLEVVTAISNTNAEARQMSSSLSFKEGIKVDADKLDKLIDYLGEFVISQTMLSQATEIKMFGPGHAITRDFDRLTKATRNLQEIGMSLRMIPVRQTFKKMNRLVRDLSKKLDKDITLITTGDETELDKAVVDKIGDPLVHMVRNSLDHGIAKNGTIELKAYHKGGSVCIEIKDNGRGLDPDKLLSKAKEKGIVAPQERLTLNEIYALIFRAGFSTAEKVTDVSGRGVGMDVVRRNIEEIHGRIDIESELGKGTTFTIKIPNTLAIIEGMVIMVGKERYVIPTHSILRSINPTGNEISTTSGKRSEVFKLADEFVPLLRLYQLYEIRNAEKDPTKGIILIVEEGGKKLGILIDKIIRQQQFVVKPLSGMMSRIPGVSGGTIMSDGQVGLIIDVGLLYQHISNIRSESHLGELSYGT